MLEVVGVSLADFGIGTVVGTSITSAVAIFLDHRRRSDERKNRFLEEKRLMYRNVAEAFDLLAEQVVYFGKWSAHFKKAEELDPEGLKLLEQMGLALQRSLAETRRRYHEHGTDFSLLASQSAARAVVEAMETLKQMLACMAADEPCDWTWMEVILKEELRNFHYFAREDLGIDA